MCSRLEGGVVFTTAGVSTTFEAIAASDTRPRNGEEMIGKKPKKGMLKIGSDLGNLYEDLYHRDDFEMNENDSGLGNLDFCLTYIMTIER